MKHTLRLVITTLAIAVAPAALPVAAQQPLFPQPFVVEHRIVQTAPDGDTFTGDAVVDHYGGSFIVSVRGDGSRLVVDLARRELTEVRPAAGTWWSVSFDRLAELASRVRSADDRVVGRENRAAAADAESEKPARVVLTRLAEPATSGDGAHAAAASSSRVFALRAELVREGEQQPVASLDAWFDPDVKLGAAARAALARLEGEALAGGQAAHATAELMAAARDRADGAFPVRSRRLVGPARDVVVEDQVLRLETEETFPAELVEVPAGLARVPHPLEVQVAWLEQEAEHAEMTRRSLSR